MAAEASTPGAPPAQATAPAASAAPNPAVRDILRTAGQAAPATPITPISSAPSAGSRPLSMHPDAVRARRRREQARQAVASQPAASSPDRATFVRPRAGTGPKYSGTQLRAEISALPAPPPPPASPEQLEKATKNIAMIIRGAGWLAATIFKREYMRVEDRDARDTATAILDGYPELASESDADYRKIMAWAAVGGLALERYSRYQREAPGAALPRAASSSGTGEGGTAGRVNGAPADLPAGLAMMPVSM